MTTNKGRDRASAAGLPTGCRQNSDGPPRPRRDPEPAPPRKEPEGPHHLEFEEPVAWLFGRQLIRSLKGVLLYSAFGSKLDPRDWMTATVHSFPVPPPTAGGDPQPAPAPDEEPWVRDKEQYPDGFWFDYISDTGDGMRATYSIAYLCLSNLAVPTRDPSKLKAGDAATPVLKNVEGREYGPEVLPRGEFLFVGGDTAYHASDYMTLGQRIYTTFNWAFEDLKKEGGLDEEEPPRPIFGIPGNHDYYDQLDGFRRQFHRPVLWEPGRGDSAGAPAPPEVRGHDEKKAQLILRGFYRSQGASYVALRLPFGWQMWGLDTETGQIDNRQKEFFRQFCGPKRPDAGEDADARIIPPPRLIVATCSPTTYFGKLASPKDFKSAAAFGQLGIDQPFLPMKGKKASKCSNGTYNLAETGDERLDPGQCRLDLSGDMHYYARYWGPPPPECSVEPRAGRDEPKADRPKADSYASVVSGIGGAFHHPTQTYFNQVCEQSLYPSEETSTAEVTRLIFDFKKIRDGGYIWLAGAATAFLIYFALTVPQSSRQFVNNLPHFGLGLATSEQVTPTTSPAPQEVGTTTTDCPEPTCTDPFWHQVPGLRFGALWAQPTPTPPCPPVPADQARYFFGPCRVEMPGDFIAGVLMALVSWAPLLLAALYGGLYYKTLKEILADLHQWLLKDDEDEDEEEEQQPSPSPGTEAMPSAAYKTSDGVKIKTAPRDPEHLGEPGSKLWFLYGLAVVLFFVGLAMAKPYRAHITPFSSSLLVLLTFVWAGACVALHLRYTEFLFKKAHDRPVGDRDWWLTYALGGAAVLAVGFGLWSFGRNNLPALLVSDIVFIVTLLLLAGGIVIAFPFLIDLSLFPHSGKWGRRFRKILVGSWHLIVQLAVPFVLVRKASVLAAVVILLALFAGRYAGEWLLSPEGGGRRLGRYGGAALASVWVLLSGLTVGLPLAFVRDGGSWFTQPWFVPGREPWFLWPTSLFAWPGTWTGWWGLLPTVLAALVGAVMCCYWFGWYLAVCFAFNGHNNEVGGAARIERFKQFVRVHLTSEGLTGYVIAVNDPSHVGSELEPHVVDVFHLRPKA